MKNASHSRHHGADLDGLPPHLVAYISEQNYDLYSAIDHASWRFIMLISKDFFKHHAHSKYLSGLEQTGITTERIPRITEMDEKLKKLGWRAVTVTGFIPPSVFAEFQSLSILPIACDMRHPEHIEYTPAPDIVHEAAGHAPIIADPKYAAFLHKLGENARRAIFAKEDLEVYEAIRHLSDIKEDPKTTKEQIDRAYRRLEEAHSRVTYASEATQISRLGWWSTEYGLVKTADGFKIYGAGLLSSVGESYNAIHGNVKKIPLTIDCINTDYDITKPQPQLFYVEDFDQLDLVIDQLAATMAYRVGGLEALERARLAGTVTTTEFDTGLQVSGVLAGIRKHERAGQDSEVHYLQYAGPVQLAYQDRELEGHSAQYHAQGFGTPVGMVRLSTPTSSGILSVAASRLTDSDLVEMGFTPGRKGRMEFVSGVVVEGELVSHLRRNEKNLVLTFKDCRVYRGDQVFFDPAWGTFDMACGERVVSVCGGAADRAAYLKTTGGLPSVIKGQTSNVTEKNRDLVPLYASVREMRERGVQVADLTALMRIAEELNQRFHQDWLLLYEIYELLHEGIWDANPRALEFKSQIQAELEHLSRQSDVVDTLIRRGLARL